MRMQIAILTALLLSGSAAAAWMEDPPGDSEYRLLGTAVPVDRASHADILALDIAETEDELVFSVTHGPAPAGSTAPLDGAHHTVYLRHGQAEYMVVVDVVFPAGAGLEHRAYLREAGDDFGFLGRLQVASEGDTAHVTVPKDMLRDVTGARPDAGRLLEDLYVESSSDWFMYIDSGDPVPTLRFPEMYDRMPEEGFGPAYEAVEGLRQEGDIMLQSREPLRWSNGEATVFVYEIEAVNKGDAETVVTLAAPSVPQGWAVSMPAPAPIAARSNHTFPVAVSVPFAHDHGSQADFVIEGHAASGIGRLAIGVYYPAVPQPTGHHDTLYLHSRSLEPLLFEEVLFTTVGQNVGEVAYVNTLETDENDEQIPVEGTKRDIITHDDLTPGPVFSWLVPLEPGLRMGLEWTGAEGLASVQFETDIPSDFVRMEGRFVLAPARLDDDRADHREPLGTVMATFVSENVAGSGTYTIEAPIIAEPGKIPFDPDQQMYLELFAIPKRPEPPLTPSLGMALLGGSLQLPLAEYHDSIPVEVSLPQAVVEEAIEAVEAAPAAETTSKKSPMGAWLSLAGLAAAAVARRR